MAEIKNLKKAAQRVEKAIKKGENIVLFSDSDLDGVVSLIILEETIKSLGGKIVLSYFPDRDQEGYGLNETALSVIKDYSPGLLILSDCGISNFKEIEKAKKMGFQVVLIEHHEIIDKLPKAQIIVDPKQKGDKYPFKFLASCGICFKLSQEIGKLFHPIGSSMEKSFLELVALATIADKMPQKEDNKIFIEKGLALLPFTLRPGLKIFFERFSLDDYSLKEIAQKIVSILQITGVEKHHTGSYNILAASDERSAKEILNKLFEEYSGRREIIRDFSSLLEEEISKKEMTLPFIFEGKEGIGFSSLGALASRICAKFKKPTFIYGIKGDLVRGSVRTMGDVNSVESLIYCKSCLETFGGHQPASGFSLKREKLEKFRECLEKYFKKNYE